VHVAAAAAVQVKSPLAQAGLQMERHDLNNCLVPGEVKSLDSKDQSTTQGRAVWHRHQDVNRSSQNRVDGAEVATAVAVAAAVAFDERVPGAVVTVTVENDGGDDGGGDDASSSD